MNIVDLLGLINNVALVLLAVAPTVFIFAVTLLGTAIDKAGQEERATRERDKNNTENEMNDVENSLQKAKKDGNTSELEERLDKLKKKQVKTQSEIRKIRIKYARIDLNNLVLYPCGSFLTAIFTGFVFHFFIVSTAQLVFIIVCQIILICYGITKIYMALSLIQEINSNKKEAEYFSLLKETYKLSLAEYYQSLKQDILVQIVDKVFPLNITTSTDLTIKFRVWLNKDGSAMSNTVMTFYIQDGIEMISPKETEFRQPADYSLPNIRTTSIETGTLSYGRHHTCEIKVKTPASPGKYVIRYQPFGDGYSGPYKDLVLHVV